MTEKPPVPLEVKQTRDGSRTLYRPDLDEHYHSVHGALQESEHVFIRMGLLPLLAQHRPLHVFEAGFGTGLNAILTYAAARQQQVQISYDTIEAYPLAPDQVAELGYANLLEPGLTEVLAELHLLSWNEPHQLSAGFRFQKTAARLEEAALPEGCYDLVYYDAFAPEKQPELWQPALFEKIFASLQPNGVLVTYCAKGAFKRMLKSVGFDVQSLPGPPGKREMVRAEKPASAPRHLQTL